MGETKEALSATLTHKGEEAKEARCDDRRHYCCKTLVRIMPLKIGVSTHLFYKGLLNA